MKWGFSGGADTRDCLSKSLSAEHSLTMMNEGMEFLCVRQVAAGILLDFQRFSSFFELLRKCLPFLRQLFIVIITYGVLVIFILFLHGFPPVQVFFLFLLSSHFHLLHFSPLLKWKLFRYHPYPQKKNNNKVKPYSCRNTDETGEILHHVTNYSRSKMWKSYWDQRASFDFYLEKGNNGALVEHMLQNLPSTTVQCTRTILLYWTCQCRIVCRVYLWKKPRIVINTNHHSREKRNTSVDEINRWRCLVEQWGRPVPRGFVLRI